MDDFEVVKGKTLIQNLYSICDFGTTVFAA